MALGLRRAKALGYLSVQLVSNISNLCGNDPPTLQTDRRTDDMQSQYRALHYSASRGKNVNIHQASLLPYWVFETKSFTVSSHQERPAERTVGAQGGE